MAPPVVSEVVELKNEVQSESDPSPEVVLSELKVLSPAATPSSSSRHPLRKPVVVPRELLTGVW